MPGRIEAEDPFKAPKVRLNTSPGLGPIGANLLLLPVPQAVKAAAGAG